MSVPSLRYNEQAESRALCGLRARMQGYPSGRKLGAIRKAARSGDVPSMVEIGIIYQNGDGVSPNFDEALE
jgi:TPR repeat protein